VLATLLPTRRLRYSARKIKAPTSRYQARHDPRPHTTTAITAIGITIYTPALDPRPRRIHYTPKNPRPPRPPTRRQRITAIITSQPARDWTPRELARMLNVHPRHLATQLREWSLLGFFTRTGLGTYRLNTPTPPPSSTSEPDP
jgi:hypothetical protein